MADRIERAALTENPAANLTTLVDALRMEGMSKQEIGSAYYLAYRHYRDTGRDKQADAIADVLDVLTGWCTPGSRLLPDEPDVIL